MLFRPRTDALLLRLSLVVGREVFYTALWGSVLASPSIRLPASLFVVGHINRGAPGREQKYMLGTDYQLTVGAPGLAGGGRWGRGWGGAGAGRQTNSPQLNTCLMACSLSPPSGGPRFTLETFKADFIVKKVGSDSLPL